MTGQAAARAQKKPPLEYSLLLTATLCLLAAGSVMVYSASSAESLFAGSGDPSYYLKRYVIFGIVGLVVMHMLSRHGLRPIQRATPLLLLVAFGLTVAVMLPGIGRSANGATRWLAAGPIQFQPSELLKIALVLYAARLLAARPARMKTISTLFRPLLLIVAAACALLLKQPDMGTALVICFSIGALLVAAGAPIRNLLMIGGALALLALFFAMLEPYRRARLTAFVDPWSDAGATGFQSVQAMIAIGSGGMFGVGLGESVQKIFYLPEAHTDMILAIIGEELGIVGMTAVAALFGMIAYAGFRTAKAARDAYSKLVAAGVTSLILCQATINFAAVLGLAPLTGVPLPFVSYGNSNLIVLLGGMGLLLNVAATGGLGARGKRGGGSLRPVEGGAGDARPGSGRRYGRTRRAGAGDRRRAAG
jgi:cell division protein FtsW